MIEMPTTELRLKRRILKKEKWEQQKCNFN
jgi:hypothetical protein